MTPPTAEQLCSVLNHFFALGKKNGWKASSQTEHNPRSGSDYTLIYIDYGNQEYSEPMTNQEAIQYIQYISNVGVANFDKPVKAKTEPQFIRPKKEYPSYLRLVVDNAKKDFNV